MPKGGTGQGSGPSSNRQPFRSSTTHEWEESVWDGVLGTGNRGSGGIPKADEEEQLGFNWDLENIPTTNHNKKGE